MTQLAQQNQKIPSLECTAVCSTKKFQNEKPNLEHEFTMYSRTYKRNSKIPIFSSRRRGVDEKRWKHKPCFPSAKSETYFSQREGITSKFIGILEFLYIYIYLLLLLLLSIRLPRRFTSLKKIPKPLFHFGI
jgi:hypothetical protein